MSPLSLNLPPERNFKNRTCGNTKKYPSLMYKLIERSNDTMNASTSQKPISSKRQSLLLNLETTRSTTTSSPFKLPSLTPDIWLNTIMSVWISDRSRMSEMSQCLPALRST